MHGNTALLLASDSHKLLYNVKLITPVHLSLTNLLTVNLKANDPCVMQIYRGRGVKLHFRSSQRNAPVTLHPEKLQRYPLNADLRKTKSRCGHRKYDDKNIVACRAVAMQCSRDRYTRAISGQRLGKHLPVSTNRHAITDVLLETGCFYVVHAEE
jgi:hypothetical protein